VIAQRERFGQILQAVADALGPGRAEKIGRAAGGQDQIVVGHRGIPRQFDPPRRKVHPDHLRQLDSDVAGVPHQRADGVGDVAGIQQRAGHLVEQRREHVIVVAVEEQDVHRCAREPAGALQAAEPGADDDHAGAVGSRRPGHARGTV